MRSAPSPSSPGISSASGTRAPLRSRAVAIALTLIAHILLLVMLLTLAPPPFLRRPEPRLITFDLPPEPRAAPTPARKTSRIRQGGGGASPRRPAPKPAASPAEAPQPTQPLQMMILSHEAFAAADIAKMPSHRSDRTTGEGQGSAGAGGGSGSSEGAGTGPGGERLYNAEWYREPTNAELAFYLHPGTAKAGSGLIACRTIANYRVDDCEELGETPAGSGLAHAVRAAAWQFRVMPPRIGGRPLVGAWVRIRIDFSETGLSAAR